MNRIWITELNTWDDMINPEILKNVIADREVNSVEKFHAEKERNWKKWDAK